MLNKRKGSFTISLDLELYWGVRDKRKLIDYQDNILGAQQIIPKMLNLFEQYDIHATWATVGFLFFKNIEELKDNLPELLPQYDDKNLSPYEYINKLSSDELTDNFNKCHFANNMIKFIHSYSNQEVASHTYSHYYIQEPSINCECFKKDIQFSIKTAKRSEIELSSLVFPRNQIDEKSINILKEVGIEVYRGNPNHWAYKDGEFAKSTLQRAYRFIDIYFNLSGYHCSLPKYNADNLTIEVKSSMFFRAYSKKFKVIENLKLRRIKNAMKEAAIEGKNFHLWWHPHNFGVNQKENLENLEKILFYYKTLQNEYGMTSKNMKELGIYAKKI